MDQTGKLRILVFGGREYPHEAFVHEELLQLTEGIPFNLVTVIHGDCNRKKKIGADYYAHTFCERWRHEGIIEDPHPAKWDDLTVPGAVIRTRPNGSQFNVRAGFQRNAEMLEKGKPTHARGFPGGAGTADMRRLLEDANRRGAGIDFKMLVEHCTFCCVPESEGAVLRPINASDRICTVCDANTRKAMADAMPERETQ